MEQPVIDLCPLCLEIAPLTSQTSCCLDFICSICGSDFIPPCPNCNTKIPLTIPSISLDLKAIVIQSFKPVVSELKTKLDQFRATIDDLIRDANLAQKLPAILKTQVGKILNQYLDDNSSSLALLLKLDHQLTQLDFYTLDFLVKLHQRADTVLTLNPISTSNQNLNLVDITKHFDVLNITYKSNNHCFYLAQNGMATSIWNGIINNRDEIIHLCYEELVSSNKQPMVATEFSILGIEFQYPTSLHLFQDDRSTILGCVLIENERLIIYELIDGCIYDYEPLLFGVSKIVMLNRNEIFVITYTHVLKYNFRTDTSQIIQNRPDGEEHIIFVDNHNIYVSYHTKLIKYDMDVTSFTILDDDCKEYQCNLVHTDEIYTLIKDRKTKTLQLKLYGTDMILGQMGITSFNVQYFNGKLLLMN